MIPIIPSAYLCTYASIYNPSPNYPCLLSCLSVVYLQHYYYYVQLQLQLFKRNKMRPNTHRNSLSFLTITTNKLYPILTSLSPKAPILPTQHTPTPISTHALTPKPSIKHFPPYQHQVLSPNHSMTPTHPMPPLHTYNGYERDHSTNHQYNASKLQLLNSGTPKDSIKQPTISNPKQAHQLQLSFNPNSINNHLIPNLNSFQYQIQQLQNDNRRLKQKLWRLKADYQNIISNLSQQTQSRLKCLLHFNHQPQSNNTISYIQPSSTISYIQSNNPQIPEQRKGHQPTHNNIINQIIKRFNQICQIGKDSNQKYLICQLIKLLQHQFLGINTQQYFGNTLQHFQNYKIPQNLQIVCLSQQLKEKEKLFNQLKQQYQQLRNAQPIPPSQLNQKQQQYYPSPEELKKHFNPTAIESEEQNSQLNSITDQQEQKQFHELVKQQLVQIVEETPTQSLQISNYIQSQLNEIQNQNNLVLSQGIQNQTIKISSAQLSHFNNIQQCYNEVLSVFGIKTHVHSHYQLMKQISTFQECLTALLNKCKQKDFELKKNIQESLELKNKYIETIILTQKQKKQKYLKDDQSDYKNNVCQYTLSNDGQFSQSNSCESTVNKILLGF